VITAAVGSCNVLLAVIGKQWLTITDDQGLRRLDNPDDYVRLEIEAALARNIRVIPILVEGAQMPRADQLPTSLAKLARRNALEVSPNRFTSDTGRLLTVLERTLADVQAGDDQAKGAVQAPSPHPAASTEPAHGHVLWALIPVLTLGRLLPVPITYAALRLRSSALLLITLAYAILWVTFLITIIVQGSLGHLGPALVVSGCLLLLAMVAAVHALWLRPVFLSRRWPRYHDSGLVISPKRQHGHIA